MLNRITLMIAIAAAAAIAILVLLPDTQADLLQLRSPSTHEAIEEASTLTQATISRQVVAQEKDSTLVSAPEVSQPSSEEPKTGWLYGNVIDLANSKLMSGAKILLDSGTSGSIGLSGPFFESTTQEDGSFRMKVPIGKWRASLVVPYAQSTGSIYFGDPPRMVHGTVEIFPGQETPFSFLFDSSTSLTGAIFEKESPQYTSLNMELVRIPDQQVVAIHQLFGDSKWQALVEGPNGKAVKNPLPPNHGGFRFEFLEPGLYEIRASLIFAEAPSKQTYWSYPVDLVSGDVDIGKHALTLQDLMGKGKWEMAKPDLKALGLED